MLELPIHAVMEPGKLVVAFPDTRVSEAAQLMKEKNVGAILVLREGRLVGIFTERDGLNRILAAGRDARTTRLEEVMTPDPKTVASNDSFGYALLLMHENGFRHVPVMENGLPVGVVSARHALDPDLEEFTVEAERRKSFRRRG